MDRSAEIAENISEWASAHREWMRTAIRDCGHHEMYFHKGRNECISCTSESKYLSLEEALEEAYPFEPAPKFRPRAMPQTALYGPGREECRVPLLRHVQDEPDMYREWVPGDGRVERYQYWKEGNVRLSARECAPGTRVWLTVGDTTGIGWKVITVKYWRGHGNGYASLISTDGISCGQFRAVDLLECEPS